MKKFLIPLFFFLLLSCSSDGFESKIVPSSQKKVNCEIPVESGGFTCLRQISESLCEEIGGTIPCGSNDPIDGDSSSSDGEEISSSSDDDASSSSRTASSSSRGAVSSSSSRAVSSSSANAVSSSSDDDDSSSSSDEDDSSSSTGNSSSSGGTVSSSSFVNVVSSSSADSPSSSSEPLPEPAWSECSIPQYVGRNEPITNLKFISIENNNGRCGAITYRLNGTGQNVTNLNYSNSSIGTNQTLNITAYTTCSGTTINKPCSGTVTVANYVKFSEANADIVLQAGKTIVEVGGVNANMFGCQARDNSESPNPFEGKTSFILNGVTASVTDNSWWVKTAISSNRMLFESNNTGVGSYRCQIE